MLFGKRLKAHLGSEEAYVEGMFSIAQVWILEALSRSQLP